MSDVTTIPTAEIARRAGLGQRRARARAGRQGRSTWALERFGGSVVLACSFQDVVIVDLVHARDPTIEVVFLDTEAHFTETLELVEAARARYDLNLTVTKPGARGRGLAVWDRPVLRAPQGRAPPQGPGRPFGLDHRTQTGRRPDPGRHPVRRLRRHLRSGQGQPARHSGPTRTSPRMRPITTSRSTRS